MAPVDAPGRPRVELATADVVVGSPATRPLPVSSCLAALAVAGSGLVLGVGLSVLGWFLGDGGGSSGQAVRAGALVWLTAHGGVPAVEGVPLSLVPLGLPLLLALLLVLGGRWAVAGSAATGPRGQVGAVAAGAGGYVVVLVLVGWAVQSSGGPGAAGVDVLRALAFALPGAAVALACGVGRALGSWRHAAARAPVELVAVVRGGLAGTAALLGVSALLLLIMVAVHADRVVALGAELRPGVAGGVALGLLCVATFPNAVLWTTSYLVGPGFAVGAGTVVAPGGVVVAAVPAYPLLGALPAPGDPSGWVDLLTVVPVLTGLLAGVVAARTLTVGGWGRLALTGAGGGAAAGLVIAASMLLSGGSVGPGRMAQTGPFLAAAVVAVLTLAVAGCAGAVAHRATSDRHRSVPGRRGR